MHILTPLRREQPLPRASTSSTPLRFGHIAGRILALAGLLTVPIGALTADGLHQMAATGASSMQAALAIANGVTAISYGTIPIFIGVFVRKRRDLPFSWIGLLFGAFILACGSTHFLHVIGIWYPLGWWQVAVDSLCAAISLATAIALWPLLPQILALPSPAQLRLVNGELERERSVLLETQTQLRRAYAEVEQRVADRTADLARANKALQAEIAEREAAQREQARLSEQLQQSQKLEAIGRLAGGVAHDFNNMLGVIIGHVDLATEAVEPSSVLQDDLAAIGKAARRSADLTRQLLAFARRQTAAPEVLDLNIAVKSMLSILRRMIGEEISLVWDPHPELWNVRIDPSHVDQILTNLCVNARDAIAGVGRVRIATAHRTFAADFCAAHPEYTPGEFVELSVRDDGRGMDPETMSHLFEPFFTTKELGQGTGLGLATVYGIVRQNGGFITVKSEQGHGSTFCVFLPRNTESVPDHVAAAPARSAPPAVRRTVLLVEDEEAILRLTSRMLERAGYRVLAAGSPHAAIRLAESHTEPIDLLVTDVMMPEMNGAQLAAALHEVFPALRCLYMSGYTADVITDRGVLDDGVSFLQKPFNAESLRAAVELALAAPLPS